MYCGLWTFCHSNLLQILIEVHENSLSVRFIDFPASAGSFYSLVVLPKKERGKLRCDKRIHQGRASTVSEICALSHLDNITVRIADIAAYLSVLGNWLRDELRSPAFP